MVQTDRQTPLSPLDYHYNVVEFSRDCTRSASHPSGSPPSSRTKKEVLHVVITGRNAKSELIEIADLVTEMTQIKHPFRSGVKAQKGIEF